MAQRIIKIDINSDGSLRIDNSLNDGEETILRELSELSAILNGQPTGFKVEAHTHEHGHGHVHHGGELHTHG